jgi:uncharacterized membrane protein (DUF485 family)
MKKQSNSYLVMNGIMFVLIWIMLIGMTGYPIMNPIVLKVGVIVTILSTIMVTFIMWDFNTRQARYDELLSKKDEMVQYIFYRLDKENKDQLLRRIMMMVESSSLIKLESLYKSWIDKPEK